MIISSAEQEYNFDAARLVLDYYPFTLDLVGARVADGIANAGHLAGTFGGDAGHPSADMLWVNARYEMTDSVLKDIEAYFGYLAQSGHGGVSSASLPPTLNGASPMIGGIRADLNLTEGFSMWAEGAYEFGDSINSLGGDYISAWLANFGAKFGMKDKAWSPSFNFNYTYASGGGSLDSGPTGHAFVPWFDYVDGYNGYLFAPMLSNIHIFNIGASVKPYENTTLSLQAYYYMKVDRDSFAGSNPNVDIGGLEFANPNEFFVQGESGQNPSNELGWELDSILGYDYSKDVRLQLVYGFFVPEDAYQKAGYVSVAHEIRGEINVKF